MTCIHLQTPDTVTQLYINTCSQTPTPVWYSGSPCVPSVRPPDDERQRCLSNPARKPGQQLQHLGLSPVNLVCLVREQIVEQIKQGNRRYNLEKPFWGALFVVHWAVRGCVWPLLTGRPPATYSPRLVTSEAGGTRIRIPWSGLVQSSRPCWSLWDRS